MFTVFFLFAIHVRAYHTRAHALAHGQKHTRIQSTWQFGRYKKMFALCKEKRKRVCAEIDFFLYEGENKKVLLIPDGVI